MADEGPALAATVTRSGRTTTIWASGILDIATVALLESAVRPELAAGVELVIDLAGVRMCDSAGLGALVRLHRHAGAVGATFSLQAPRRHVADVLGMTGINKVITVRSAPASPQ